MRVLLGHEVLDDRSVAVLEAVRAPGAEIVEFGTVTCARRPQLTSVAGRGSTAGAGLENSMIPSVTSLRFSAR